MQYFNRSNEQPGKLTLMPYILKTDLFGPESEAQRIDAELGRLLVPENRSKPDTKLIELAFVRLKSTAARPGPPLIFLAGGPGVSGIDGLRWDVLFPWFRALREVGDVIALDQRGTGLSNPHLDCLERWDLPLEQPGARDEYLRSGREQCQKCAHFWRERSVDLSGYTTQESADDINSLRRALGYEQVNLYGASYGSHLALATVKRHGQHIAHAVVAMVEGLDHTIKLPSNIQRHLEDLDALVQHDPQLHKHIPDFLDTMRTVINRLERNPVTVEVSDPLTKDHVKVALSGFDLQLLTASGIGSARFISKLPARYHAMLQGDYSWLASKVLERRREWIGNAMSYVMDCASGISEERYARVQREAPETLLGDLVNFPFPDICTAWKSSDLGSAFRAPLTSPVPTLFLSGTLDGRTPLTNAREVQAGFAQSHEIIIEHATHSTAEIVNAPGVTAAMLDFLRGQPVTLTKSHVPFKFAPVAES